MSINFSEGLEETPVVTTSSHLPEDVGEGSLRPRTITEYIGQEKAKNRDHDAGQRTQNQRRVDAISRVFFLTRAEILRHADIDAVGQADEKARKQRDER